ASAGDREMKRGDRTMSTTDHREGEMRLRISRRRLLATTGAVAGLGLAGAGLPVISGSALADTPQKGGTLKVGRVADAISFDPVFLTDNMSIWAKLLIFQMLIRT